jgi:hypothetical protein
MFACLFWAVEALGFVYVEGWSERGPGGDYGYYYVKCGRLFPIRGSAEHVDILGVLLGPFSFEIPLFIVIVGGALILASTLVSVSLLARGRRKEYTSPLKWGYTRAGAVSDGGTSYLAYRPFRDFESLN